MYDTILLPVSPGSTANAAIPHAKSLAERYDATVYVVSAIDTVAQTLRGPQAGSFAKRVEDAAEERVETVTAELEAAGIDVVGSVLRGEPLEVITNAIDDVGADIVVMPSHTRRGLQRVLLGSVTEKVVRVSPVPVVTVPIRESDDGDAAGDSDGDAAERPGGEE
ncbi:UspA domain protein [Halorubrum aidingense JCM 13560]|uniref:UspA domain protein n=1 Tax=Halorubrum aidingense JCM 13560 TaxID=1230454 RepID=M0PF92_9EURY|nr:universal stress protein [Halorubrum aidingense]EMA67455.1 UspA domain protein [Halorubrum aidingense JCM 13560]